MHSAPTVELDGRTYVMVPHETGQLMQTGNTVVLSEREVRAVVAKLERYEATNHPNAEAGKAKLSAYRQLLSAAGEPAATAKKKG